MVEFVNNSFKKPAIRGALLWLCAVSPFASAESLSDPTRPPASLGFAHATLQTVASGPVLQSVFISAGQKVAIISGQTVSLGGRYGDSEVVKITDGEVTLLSGKSLRTLKLFPNVEKRMYSGRESFYADSLRQ
jgi:MSHA biogenesis protein MshK